MTPSPALQFGFLGYAARLADPGALHLLWVVAALAALGAIAIVRRRRALARLAGPLAPRLAPDATVARPAARLSLSLLGLAALVVALARPQCGARAEVAQRFGVDLVVALDVSRSMRARDVPPDRLSRAELEVGELLDQLAGDRVGVVVFAEDAFVQCPLTTDYAAAKLFLRAVSPDSIPQQGTDLASALLAAKEVLDGAERGARAKVVLLVTDGEDLEGGGAEAAAALADAGVRVFALGVGTPEGAPIPDAAAPGGWRRDRSGAPIVTRLDPASLRALAARGGGRAYDLGGPGGGGLAAFRAELDRMEKSALSSRTTVAYDDRYALAAFPGFLLLLAGLLLREGRPRPAGEGA